MNTPDFERGNVKLFNADNMKIMAQYPDNYFDLAVVDPPYGIGANKEKPHNGWKYYGIKQWDNKRPPVEYFIEVQRISKNQIIWGGNYFADLLPPKMGWIVWDKGQRNFSLADAELAWTSFQKAIRFFDYARAKANKKNKIHATQKPVELYDFCFVFAKAQKDWKIIDTHLGSASSAISAHYFGFTEFVGIELDSDYFNDAVKRFKTETMQQKLF